MTARLKRRNITYQRSNFGRMLSKLVTLLYGRRLPLLTLRANDNGRRGLSREGLCPTSNGTPRVASRHLTMDMIGTSVSNVNYEFSPTSCGIRIENKTTREYEHAYTLLDHCSGLTGYISYFQDESGTVMSHRRDPITHSVSLGTERRQT